MSPIVQLHRLTLFLENIYTKLWKIRDTPLYSWIWQSWEERASQVPTLLMPCQLHLPPTITNSPASPIAQRSMDLCRDTNQNKTPGIPALWLIFSGTFGARISYISLSLYTSRSPCLSCPWTRAFYIVYISGQCNRHIQHSWT